MKQKQTTYVKVVAPKICTNTMTGYKAEHNT